MSATQHTRLRVAKARQWWYLFAMHTESVNGVPLGAEEDPSAPFGTVAIIGVGLIGGSLGMALKQRGLARRIIGIGRDPARLDKAARLGAIDTGSTDLAEGVTDADIVIVCTTIGHILDTLPQTLRLARPDAVVTDVGSTKSAIVQRAEGAPRFVGGHPMAGSEQTGVEAAAPTLFQEATWALTPTERTDPQAAAVVRRLAQSVGAATLLTTPDAHDAMVAVTSHLPHVLASALMRQAAGVRATLPDVARLSAGSFADGTRVAAASPEIWRDVCLSNQQAVLRALHDFRGQLGALEAAVAAQDAGAIEAFFAAGRAAKREWNAR